MKKTFIRVSPVWFFVLGVIATLPFPCMTAREARAAAPAQGPKLYVFDCGTIEGPDPARYSLKENEVAVRRFSIGCFLVVHPKGTLMWDVGAVKDEAWKPTSSAVTHELSLPDGQHRTITLRKGLLSQLAEIGVSPRDVTYLAVSHSHYDHTANTNAFAAATWLTPQTELDSMFVPVPQGTRIPDYYSALRSSKRVVIPNNDYDVFGDGTVVIKPAPGHTPGHQVLYLKLAQTGGVILVGDLYHFPEERALGRLPTSESSAPDTAASRAKIEAFAKENKAQLWIQHDFVANEKLKKSPASYE